MPEIPRVVFQGRLHPSWRPGFIASHLSYTWEPWHHCKAGVKVHGVFPSDRGYSVFTENSISLSWCWRQRGSRYAIRAGRNLPDKEFRYLRTVIVTAAVYRGFSSELAPLPLTFRHRAGVRPYTSSCQTSQSPVFLVNSRHPLVCAPRPGLRKDGALFSRSYEGNLPSSFNTILSSAWVCSTCPPVSVWGTVYHGGAVSWKASTARPIRSGRTDFSLRHLRQALEY